MAEPQRILHLCFFDKFIPPFIDFLEEHFLEFSRHRFIVLVEKEILPDRELENVAYLNTTEARLMAYGAVAQAMYGAEKVIIHGLWSIRLVQFLACNPWLLPKCYWAIWGGDLYQNKQVSQKRGARIDELFRRFVIKRMGNLISCVDGDVAHARRWYGARGRYHECLMYPSNTYRFASLPAKTSATLTIQIGNSADPSNGHMEMIEMLRPYRNRDVRIYAPLSYGSADYAAAVAEAGRDAFGENFISMERFLPFHEYLQHLANIDIALFNHRRQQAMGNIIVLLGLGKRVYLRRDTSLWGLFEKAGVVVHDVSRFSLDGFEEFDPGENADRVRAYFSTGNLVAQYAEIFC